LEKKKGARRNNYRFNKNTHSFVGKRSKELKGADRVLTEETNNDEQQQLRYMK